MSSMIPQHDLAQKPSNFALGTRLNHAVNDRLNQPRTAMAKPLAGACDVFTRAVSRDAQAGARVLAAPRHLLNHVAGGAAVAPKVLAGDGVHQASAQRSEGLLWHTLASTSREVSRAVGGACGVVGTAVGAAGGAVLPAVSSYTAKDCVSVSESFARRGESLANRLLTGVSTLASEVVAGASAAVTGLLAGAGALVGGAIGVLHGMFQALGASFRREGAVKMAEECETIAPRQLKRDGADAILTRSGDLGAALSPSGATL